MRRLEPALRQRPAPISPSASTSSPPINDAFGYEAADQVIVEIGQRLDRCLRVSDVIGRVGGDRFGIVLAHCRRGRIIDRGRGEDPGRGRARCRSTTAAGPVYATVSIGSAAFPEQAKTSYEVMTRAETALAEAKRAGRDCFVPYRLSEEQRQQHRIGMALGERVQRALARGPPVSSPISRWSTPTRAPSITTNACCA